ncbi:hypothetical protein HMPREF9622_02786 [Cutibacterium modestum HL037PA3]|nr:hypothetical protein HMPREF9622_02786 [Cutibacterium modestum HL037PA3]
MSHGCCRFTTITPVPREFDVGVQDDYRNSAKLASSSGCRWVCVRCARGRVVEE